MNRVEKVRNFWCMVGNSSMEVIEMVFGCIL